MTSTKWALCAAVTEEMLNDLAVLAVGEGVTLEQVETDVALPAMGDVRLRVTLTVNGGTFNLRSSDGGRARVVVTATGEVVVEALGFEGSTAPAVPMLPSEPIPIPIRAEALVDPVVELRSDHTVQVGLALEGSELIGVSVDTDAPPPEGVDPATWMPMTQIVNMLFSGMGDQLWSTLGEQVGVVGADLGASVGDALVDLGALTGRADVRITSGLMTIGLAAAPDVEGRATPLPVAGKRVALSLTRSGVDHVATLLLAMVAGDRPLPFEIQLDLGDRRVQSTLRQTRLLSERIPDLRLALRSDLRPRLTGGRLEVALHAAWVELPEPFPTFGITDVINGMNRRIGGLAAFAPLRMRFPAVIHIPIGGEMPGETPDVLGVEIDDLHVGADGIGVVVGLA